jgi:hypothetical protein
MKSIQIQLYFRRPSNPLDKVQSLPHKSAYLASSSTNYKSRHNACIGPLQQYADIAVQI